MEWAAGSAARYVNQRKYIDVKRLQTMPLVEGSNMTLEPVRSHEMKAEFLKKGLLPGDTSWRVSAAKLFIDMEAV